MNEELQIYHEVCVSEILDRFDNCMRITQHTRQVSGTDIIETNRKLRL